MIDPEEFKQLRTQVAECVISDRNLQDELLDEVEQLRQREQRIQPRSTTSVSVVGTDGGNNELRFDPFMVQIVRIVDSNKNQLWLEVVSPTTPVAHLNARHISSDGQARSPLGRMMLALKVKSVAELSPVVRDGTERNPRSPSWTNVYRELTEWAVLLDLTKKDYGSDTLIIFDGFLRSKVFKGTLSDADYSKTRREKAYRHRSVLWPRHHNLCSSETWLSFIWIGYVANRCCDCPS